MTKYVFVDFSKTRIRDLNATRLSTCNAREMKRHEEKKQPRYDDITKLILYEH